MTERIAVRFRNRSIATPTVQEFPKGDAKSPPLSPSASAGRRSRMPQFPSLKPFRRRYVESRAHKSGAKREGPTCMPVRYRVVPLPSARVRKSRLREPQDCRKSILGSRRNSSGLDGRLRITAIELKGNVALEPEVAPERRFKIANSREKTLPTRSSARASGTHASPFHSLDIDDLLFELRSRRISQEKIDGDRQLRLSDPAAGYTPLSRTPSNGRDRTPRHRFEGYGNISNHGN